MNVAISGIVKTLKQVQFDQDYALSEFAFLLQKSNDGTLQHLYEMLKKAKEDNDQVLKGFKQIMESSASRVKTKPNPPPPTSLGVPHPSASGYSYPPKHFVPQRLSQGNNGCRENSLPNRLDSFEQPLDAASQILCQNYNAGIENPQRKNEFLQLYKPLRVGVTNVMKRYHSLDIKPLFETRTDGDYYAVAIKGDTRYVVVPRFDLTFQEFLYGPGAMGEVFESPNYNPQLRYRRVKVVKPALFEPNSAKQWTLIDKGELDLGQGEWM